MRVALSTGRVTCLLLASILFPQSSQSQNPSPESSRLASITVHGLKRFTQEQVIAASGLQTGRIVGLQDLEAAVKRLANSGAFDKVTYRYRARNAEMLVEFEVEESQKFWPCVYDNFIWFSNEEIAQSIRRQVPLYDGSAPQGGSIVEQITAVLTQMLQARGVHRDVEHMPFFDIATGERGHEFRVSGAALPIRALSFPGADGIPEDKLRQAAKGLLGQDYSVLSVKGFVRAGLLPLYTERGYLAARFLEPQAAALANETEGEPAGVAVTAPVEEGPTYYWDRADWAENHAIPGDELDSKLGMKESEIANAQKIAAGFSSVQQAFKSHGYLEVNLHTEQILDQSRRRVHYHVVVEEGPQFRMGTLTFVAVDASTAERLRSSWKLKSGEILDASYTSEYLRKTAAEILAHSRACPHFELKFVTDRQRGTADVQLVCH